MSVEAYVHKCNLVNSSEELQLSKDAVEGGSTEISDTQQFGSLDVNG